MCITVYFFLQLENANLSVVKPLEDFRKKYIGGVKMEKKKFEKQTAKFCQNQERYLNLTTKKTNSLMEVSPSSFSTDGAGFRSFYFWNEEGERVKFFIDC